LVRAELLKTMQADEALMSAGLMSMEQVRRNFPPLDRQTIEQFASCDGRLDRGQTGKIDIEDKGKAT
jgi:hypothetical protein